MDEQNAQGRKTANQQTAGGSTASPLTAELTVGQLTEGQLLARIFPKLRVSDSALLGPGDDAAVVTAPDGRVVISVDTLVQDQDFRLLWNNGYSSSGFEVGWKAAAQNLSDINAMGAVATAMVVSLTLPEQTPVCWSVGLAEGMSEAISALGAERCAVVGGDLSGGREIAVTVTVLGDLAGAAPVLRSGAKPGDQLAFAGQLGLAAAGWALLESELPLGSLGPEQRDLIEAFHHPRPPLTAGPLAAACGATAMLDISDGLIRDAGRLAEASGVQIDLDPVALAGYVAALEPTAALLGESALAWVLGGGEDHGLLSTFDGDAQLPSGFAAIGSVLSKQNGTAPDAAVTVAGRHSDTVGWDHFAD